MSFKFFLGLLVLVPVYISAGGETPHIVRLSAMAWARLPKKQKALSVMNITRLLFLQRQQQSSPDKAEIGRETYRERYEASCRGFKEYMESMQQQGISTASIVDERYKFTDEIDEFQKTIGIDPDHFCVGGSEALYNVIEQARLNSPNDLVMSGFTPHDIFVAYKLRLPTIGICRLQDRWNFEKNGIMPDQWVSCIANVGAAIKNLEGKGGVCILESKK